MTIKDFQRLSKTLQNDTIFKDFQDAMNPVNRFFLPIFWSDGVGHFIFPTRQRTELIGIIYQSIWFLFYLTELK